jgi:SnoaL-like protein
MLGRTAVMEVRAMANMNELAAEFERVLRTGDFGKVMELAQEYASDDFVQEWPQSGERLTRAASIRLGEQYAEKSGTNPAFSYKRMIGGGDVFVIEGTIDYGDGIPVSYVGIGELRDGKVSKMTEYFANPFEAPAWRADFVEQMAPAKA